MLLAVRESGRADHTEYLVWLCHGRYGIYGGQPFLFDGYTSGPLHRMAEYGWGYSLRIPPGYRLKPSEVTLIRWAIKIGFWVKGAAGSSDWESWEPPDAHRQGNDGE